MRVYSALDMLRRDARARFRGLPGPALILLLTLVTMTLVVEGSQPAHSHSRDTVALYNAECPLAALAAFNGASPLPESPPSTAIALVAGSPLPTPDERPATSPARHSAPRAPPLA
jgi:hypothetical protein